jgi:hypothetical protein
MIRRGAQLLRAERTADECPLSTRPNAEGFISASVRFFTKSRAGTDVGHGSGRSLSSGWPRTRPAGRYDTKENRSARIVKLEGIKGSSLRRAPRRTRQSPARSIVVDEIALLRSQ